MQSLIDSSASYCLPLAQTAWFCQVILFLISTYKDMSSSNSSCSNTGHADQSEYPGSTACLPCGHRQKCSVVAEKGLCWNTVRLWQWSVSELDDDRCSAAGGKAEGLSCHTLNIWIQQHEPTETCGPVEQKKNQKLICFWLRCQTAKSAEQDGVNCFFFFQFSLNLWSLTILIYRPPLCLSRHVQNVAHVPTVALGQFNVGHDVTCGFWFKYVIYNMVSYEKKK